MLPSVEIAENELNIAEQLNRGLWVNHSKNVASASKIIAECVGLDGERAYVSGLLHDIGRRTGIAQIRHIIDGYDYCMVKRWKEVARVCLTHSFPVKDVDADIGKIDITPEQYAFIKKYIRDVEYDDYDKLIILCDALADANGFCILEKRFIDTTRRYGIFPFTLDRWNKTYEYKEYFESKMGKSVYAVLPEIEKSIYL